MSFFLNIYKLVKVLKIVSKMPNMAQKCSKWLKNAQNGSKMLKMGQKWPIFSFSTRRLAVDLQLLELSQSVRLLECALYVGFHKTWIQCSALIYRLIKAYPYLYVVTKAFSDLSLTNSKTIGGHSWYIKRVGSCMTNINIKEVLSEKFRTQWISGITNGQDRHDGSWVINTRSVGLLLKISLSPKFFPRSLGFFPGWSLNEFAYQK